MASMRNDIFPRKPFFLFLSKITRCSRGSLHRGVHCHSIHMLIDISLPFASHVPVWPGDIPFSCGWTARREDGAAVNLGALTMSAHAGTHADAPLHVESSWRASESLPADVFVGPVHVIALPTDLASDAVITRELVVALLALRHTDVVVPMRILCRTNQSVSHDAFPDAWPALSEDAADWLTNNGLRLWGTDAPSVDARPSKELPVHHALFSAGAYVLENLALRDVVPGVYELLAQPLAIHGADAAPVRAMLRAV